MLERIGKYEIRLQIGRGGMGIVYEGFDPSIERRVAIKTLRTENIEPGELPEFLVRFKREAQLAGRLSHPHIVTIYDYGDERGTPYIVMEYMNGRELADTVRRGERFPVGEVLRIMTQFLGALQFAHENGVVHRDLKPSNIFLLSDGSLKVLDFGIARMTDADLTQLTQSGARLGTPAYMSPEQFQGIRSTERSDIYSAGVILYELLTGDRPFSGSFHTIMPKVLKQDPMPPSDLNPTLSTAWDVVVARAMSKKPEARYETARQFLEAIRAAHEAGDQVGDAAKRKRVEAEEHANREAAERSREEARRREEFTRTEIERREREENEAKRRAEADAGTRRQSEAKATVAPTAGTGKGVWRAATVIAVATAVIVTLFYFRQSAQEQASKAETARAAAESQVRDEAGKRVRAEALAREEAEKRLKVEAEVARRGSETNMQAALPAKARVEEEAKKSAEDKSKLRALKREEEERRKADAASNARIEVEAKFRAEMEAKRLAEEGVRRDAQEKAKAIAEREEAEKALAKRRIEEDVVVSRRRQVDAFATFLAGKFSSDCGNPAQPYWVHIRKQGEEFLRREFYVNGANTSSSTIPILNINYLGPLSGQYRYSFRIKSTKDHEFTVITDLVNKMNLVHSIEVGETKFLIRDGVFQSSGKQTPPLIKCNS